MTFELLDKLLPFPPFPAQASARHPQLPKLGRYSIGIQMNTGLATARNIFLASRVRVVGHCFAQCPESLRNLQ